MGPTLLRPKSKGSITLQSKNPFDQAIIDPNFLAEQEDVDFFVRGKVKFSYLTFLLKSQIFKKYLIIIYVYSDKVLLKTSQDRCNESHRS